MKTGSIPASEFAAAMRARVLFASCALAAVLAAGCAALKEDTGELPLPAQRLSFDSYSFMPPAEKGWFVAERDAEHVVLAKAGKYLGQTLTVQGGRVALPAAPSTLLLVNHVRSTQAQGLAPPRFRVRSHDVVPATVNGAACVASLLETEDREAGSTSGPIVALLVQTVSLTCRDPARPDSGVTLSYTHRAYPEDRDPAFQARAEPVINSLQLSAPAQR